MVRSLNNLVYYILSHAHELANTLMVFGEIRGFYRHIIEVIILARPVFRPDFGHNFSARRIFLALGGLWANQKRLFSLFFGPAHFGPQKPANLGPK